MKNYRIKIVTSRGQTSYTGDGEFREQWDEWITDSAATALKEFDVLLAQGWGCISNELILTEATYDSDDDDSGKDIIIRRAVIREFQGTSADEWRAK